MRLEILQKSILPNHNLYTYTFPTVEECMAHLAVVQKLRKAFKLRHPLAKFKTTVTFGHNTSILTVEVWTLPVSSLN